MVGAGLTGGFTLLKGRQERVDKERDRLEQRTSRHREIRRDAYIALLSDAKSVDSLQRDFSPSNPLPRTEYLRELTAATDQLYQSLLIVRIEGPDEVAAAAQELVSKYSSLSNQMHSDDGVTLGDLLNGRLATLQAREEFLAVTARALDSRS